MQSATQATLTNLVEQHITSLVRESAVVNRHSNKGGYVSAAGDDTTSKKNSDAITQGREKRRRLIHHDDINLALSWRGSDKLYVSGIPLTNNNSADDDIATPFNQLVQNTTGKALLGASSAVVPRRVDLNSYLQSEMQVKPPCEIGMTLHWLAVNGTQPRIPMNDVWTAEGGSKDLVAAPVLELVDEDITKNDNTNDDSSIRIRELQNRILSEELQLYYKRVISTINNPISTIHEVNSVLIGLRTNVGLQELIPFISRFISTGLMSKSSSTNGSNNSSYMSTIGYYKRLILLFDAMLDNNHIHLDLFLHQLFVPVGTCIVAKKLCSPEVKGGDVVDHWSLRELAARTLLKAANIYSNQYTTLKPRIIKLLTSTLTISKKSKPLSTIYGGIVGISLFGVRAIDCFLLPVVSDYWNKWEDELTKLTNGSGSGKDGKRNKEERIYEIQMCQMAILNAIRIYIQGVSIDEQVKRVNVDMLINVFGERLIPMLQSEDITDYIGIVL